MINITQNGNTINIEGRIKSPEDSEQIERALDEIKNLNDSIVLNVKDSQSLTSSVIGYLIKLVNNGKRVYINVSNSNLYELLDDLGLKGKFTVNKV